MADVEDCKGDVFVMIDWEGRSLGVPLSQLTALDANDDTEEAAGDWRYWTERGYQFF